LLLLRHPQFETFACVKAGHVLTIKEGDHIFLKAVNVIDCATFDQQCKEINPKASISTMTFLENAALF
jgi:hypothetical protein